MARYIDADALFESVKSKRLIFEESTPAEEAIAEQISVFEEAIEEAPTADVAPKSEVAREIFAEIEEIALEHEMFGRTCFMFGQGTLAELKKKYTGEVEGNG